MSKKITILKNEIEKIIQNSPIPTDSKHSKSTRDWILKLNPSASKELLIAALSHDIERGERRGENRFENYDEYKKYHSKRSSEIIAKLMKKHGFDKKTIKKVKNLVLRHEIGGTENADLLRDADSLSFFEDNIKYYYKNRGEGKTRFKINYMYNRCSKKTKTMIKNMKFSNKLNKIIKEEID